MKQEDQLKKLTKEADNIFDLQMNLSESIRKLTKKRSKSFPRILVCKQEAEVELKIKV